jgi:ferredoxin/flavodoxin
MKKILIAYHSGTGTTKILVQTLHRLLMTKGKTDIKELSLPSRNVKKDSRFLARADLIFFVYPCYYCDASPPVLDFIESLPVFEKPLPVFQIISRALYTANAVSKVARRLEKHNLFTVGHEDIRAPGVDVVLMLPLNFFKGYQPSAFRKLARAALQAEKIMTQDKIRKRTPFLKWYSPFAFVLQRMVLDNFRHNARKMFIDDDCTNCGLCIGLCVLRCWSNGKQKPVRHPERCIVCLNCVHKCPARAILYNKAMKMKPRFSGIDYEQWEEMFRTCFREREML